jgi:hypothetical protein
MDRIYRIIQSILFILFILYIPVQFLIVPGTN